MNTKRPVILLFGMPRSGTTWLGKIFDSHPNVLYRHEPDSWIKLDNLGLYEELDHIDLHREYLKNYVDGLMDINLPQVTTKRPIFNKCYSSLLRFQCFRASVYASLLLSRIDKRLALPTVSPVSPGKKSNLRIAWKSIESLGRMGLIMKSGQCKGVQIIRHPCGCISSILNGEASKNFLSSDPASEDYGSLLELLETKNAKKYGLDEHLLRKMSAVERLAWRWLLVNEKAVNDLSHSDNYRVLRYEELCEQPLAVSRELFDFAGLRWQHQTEEFIRSSVGSENHSYYSVFKNPQVAANKWRSYLSAEQQEQIMGVVTQSQTLSEIYGGQL